MLASGFTKYQNTNPGIDTNVNINLNNDYLDCQLSRAKSSNINICIKDVKSQYILSNKGACAQTLKYFQALFLRSKELRLKI